MQVSHIASRRSAGGSTGFLIRDGRGVHKHVEDVCIPSLDIGDPGGLVCRVLLLSEARDVGSFSFPGIYGQMCGGSQFRLVLMATLPLLLFFIESPSSLSFSCPLKYLTFPKAEGGGKALTPSPQDFLVYEALIARLLVQQLRFSYDSPRKGS